jgi:hypothetical protein
MDERSEDPKAKARFVNACAFSGPHGLTLCLALVVFASFACSGKGGGAKDGGFSPDVLCYHPTASSGSAGESTQCFPLCSKEDDCAGLVMPGIPCQTGYTCMIPTTKGRLACTSICKCKDFLGSASPQVPIACRPNAGP